MLYINPYHSIACYDIPCIDIQRSLNSARFICRFMVFFLCGKQDALRHRYLQLLKVFKELDTTHRFTVQPQQSLLIEQILEAVVGMLICFWNETSCLQNNGRDAIDVIPGLCELDMTPDDLEVPVPTVFQQRRQDSLERYHEAIMQHVASLDQFDECSNVEEIVRCDGVEGHHGNLPHAIVSSEDVASDGGCSLSSHEEVPSRPSLQAIDTNQKLQILAFDSDSTSGSKPKMSSLATAIMNDSDRLSAKLQHRQEERRADLQKTVLSIKEQLRHESDTNTGTSRYGMVQDEVRIHDVDNTGVLDKSVQQLSVRAISKTSKVTRTASTGTRAKTTNNVTMNRSNQIWKDIDEYGMSITKSIDAWMSLRYTPVPSGNCRNSFHDDDETVDASTAIKQCTAVHRLSDIVMEGGTSAVGSGGENESIKNETIELEDLPRLHRGSSTDEIDMDAAMGMVKSHYFSAINSNSALRDNEPKNAINSVSISSSKIAAHDEKRSRKQTQNAGPQLSKVSMTANEIRHPSIDYQAESKDKECSHGNEDIDLNVVEPLLSKLGAEGIARKCPCDVQMKHLIGWDKFSLPMPSRGARGPHLDHRMVLSKAKAGGKAANAAVQQTQPLLLSPELSIPQIRQLATLQLVLPLASFQCEKPRMDPLPESVVYGSHRFSVRTRPLSVLLYGPQGTGKTLLAEAITAESRAAFFDITPFKILQTCEGNQVTNEVRSVFQAAKSVAPSVIYIDQVETVFIQDEMRASSFACQGQDPPNKLRKPLMEGLAMLKPTDGVLVIGCSSCPQACVACDEVTFLEFFQLLIQLPIPDSLSRREMIKSFAKELGAELQLEHDIHFDETILHALTKATEAAEGFTPKQLRTAMQVAVNAFRKTEPCCALDPHQSSGCLTISEDHAPEIVSESNGLEKAHFRKENSQSTWCILLHHFEDEIRKLDKVDQMMVNELQEWTARAYARKRSLGDKAFLDRKGNSDRQRS